MEQPSEKKKRPNSKAKGSGFENTVAKQLSKHLAPLNFMRTQGSGARVGGKNFETLGKMFGEDALKLFVGDVVPINERDTGLTFKFSVETKFYKTPDHFPALVSGNANFFKWFEEAVEDAEKVGKIPMLICKWNHTSIFVAVPHNPSALVNPRFSLVQKRHIDVYDLDDLLGIPNFWIENVPTE